MAITLQPSILKYKDGQGNYQNAGVVVGNTPPGGTTGQALIKASGTDYDVEWGAVKDAAGQAMIAVEETSTTATAPHAVNSLFRLDGKLYKATSAIAVGDTIIVSGNCTETNIDGELIKDIRVNGTSILNNGVANVPYASASTPGVAKASSTYGVDISVGTLIISAANANSIKDGTYAYKPIVPSNQHQSVFYGLAKAAGDSTQSASNNAVGTYTEDAKSKISEMLDAPVTITGTTPSITGKAGIRYICGECATLTIAPPASGDVEVIFESGTTATVLTITPPTGITAVKWPAWFDPTDLEASCTYDIIITNGEFGVVTSWA